MSRLSVILPAAGRSVRFGENKLLAPLAGRAVIAYALDAFLTRSDVAQIIIASHEADLLRQAMRGQVDLNDPRIIFCPGGAHRAESVRIAAGRVDPAIRWIAIHDAARPLISQALIDATFALAQSKGAAAPALAAHLTIKQAQGSLPARIERTLPRQQLYAMQTPQIVDRAALLSAMDRCPIALEAVTDDLQLLELAGIETWLCEGEQRNLKITHPTDLLLAEALLKQP